MFFFYHFFFLFQFRQLLQNTKYRNFFPTCFKAGNSISRWLCFLVKAHCLIYWWLLFSWVFMWWDDGQGDASFWIPFDPICSKNLSSCASEGEEFTQGTGGASLQLKFIFSRPESESRAVYPPVWKVYGAGWLERSLSPASGLTTLGTFSAPFLSPLGQSGVVSLLVVPSRNRRKYSLKLSLPLFSLF